MPVHADLSIRPGDLDDPRVVALLLTHVERARAETEPGSSHALDMSGLRAADVTFWAAWRGEEVVGLAALKRLSATHGEVKSMHVADSARGRGTGSSLLDHIVAAARQAGLTRLSLETGSWDYFRPARRLYRRFGFVECGPFGDYRLDRNSVFMTIQLETAQASAAPMPPAASAA
ncbi:GNAT family N-acetyltransferase [Sphingosinicella terrae]|uniref:GNAT family N-acetyltransferase n=1 Tax=Sphingosinicella terrae TaxID=2172047 RepID=UPI000E0D65F1|nr:GNAT family N-acetyltransferase [Sphingosinicella terrae]